MGWSEKPVFMRVSKKLCCCSPPFLLLFTPLFFHRVFSVVALGLCSSSGVLGYRPNESIVCNPVQLCIACRLRKERVAVQLPPYLLSFCRFLFRGLFLFFLFCFCYPLCFSFKSVGLVWVLLPVNF